MILTGSLLVIGTLVSFAFLTNEVENMTDSKVASIFPSLTVSLGRSVLSGLVATGNGIVIYVLTEIYKYLSRICVDWENHVYLSDE